MIPKILNQSKLRNRILLVCTFLIVFLPNNGTAAYSRNLTTTTTKKIILDAPLISQNPELPRGCEVTSLAMLLQHAGVMVDKLTLAKAVKKDPTPYKKHNGIVHFGNPYNGFVGDMYTKRNKGLGVYHAPIADLADQFLATRIIDLTGEDFTQVYKYLVNGSPVWVITNATFEKLPKSSFETWHTPTGIINITYHEHSVLVTGFDEHFIYFNDPLSGIKNTKAPKEEFIASWVQMGKQAITYWP
ncbi:C39 family peptidase [Bacillus luteolus]|uniref:C39 family peptidase n=2 Tax=Litchfieldia luteola TaxID=682179 RepID=A0ABR9QIX8_9BACI|nr:C39 family peptidase [Cytobacillus luteolus]MBE4908371.1 C39 family peptidase [Cytobacillus luteolus]